MTDQADWSGYLTLEGPLLEMAYAALCISRGENVVPRYETLGVIHDVLVEEKEGYAFCECAGQPEITEEKLKLFEKEVLDLDKKLAEMGEKCVRSARFISMVGSGEWREESRDLLEEIRQKFADNSIELVIENPKKTLYELISRSIIGLRIMDNKVFFVGPGEWAVRYDAKSSRFKFGESDIEFEKFRKMPQSFLPRDYWTRRYRESFVEYALSSMESIPEWFSWEYPNSFGIRWNSRDQIRKAIMASEEKSGRKIVEESDDGFITLTQIKKMNYYTASVVYHSDRIIKESGPEIERSFSKLIESAIENSTISLEGDILYRIYTDTVTFSPNFWSTVKDRVYDGHVEQPGMKRGDDVILETLNSGVIGFKLANGRITLSLEEGKNTLMLDTGALKWETEKEGAYPASLKF